MTIQQAYKKFLLKINKNDTNDEVRISPAEFVLSFNEERLNWLREKIKQKASDDSINDIDELLIEDEELSEFNEKRDHNDFILPIDYFHFVSANALGERDGCEKDLEVINIKPKDKNTILKDEMNNPSFEWEETISLISNGKIQIYKSDFDVSKLWLSYYREPIAVDIEGYLNIDKTTSKTINPDLSDTNVNEIINRCAAEIARDYQNGESFQLREQKISTEK